MVKDVQIDVIAYFAMVLFLCMSTIALAETEVVISKKNRFGGITKKINYSAQDDQYKAGIQQVIDYSDSHGNKRKIEIYTGKEHSQKLDLDMIIHYRSTGRVIELFSSDNETGVQGVSKVVLYCNLRNILQKREYYFAKGSPLSKLGVYKRVIHYDETGRVTRVEHLDKFDKRVMPQ
ncbi:MAG: hypothetical protein OEV22_17140 [Deltaproteobacteria bacterium]|jgi:hypothetical protein|nr:hypothetical protein [Deltaproteobacteria bacterium]